MTALKDDDPAHASVRTAESVVALARAELKLVALEAKTASTRLIVTAVFGVVTAFLAAVAVVIVVLMPVLWAFRPSAALATLGIALGLALVAAIATLVRLRRQRAPESHEGSYPPEPAAFRGHPHAREH